MSGYEEGFAISGADRIAAERRRQIEEEGYTVEHDQSMPYEGGDLIKAAICYATPQHGRDMERTMANGVAVSDAPVLWPWAPETWKGSRNLTPSNEERVRELEKAGALIAAEIDRLLADE